MSSLELLSQEILACARCPRLRAYHAGLAVRNPDWHCRPVPGFGDAGAAIALVGLAPSKTGGNRTGRIFTGDKTAEFLFDALHRAGFSSRADSLSADDGLRLEGIYLTPALKCAPPHDKPLPQELRNCAEFLKRELALLKNLKVVIALGKIGHDAYLRLNGLSPAAHPFSHGALHRLDGCAAMLDTYHCSPRNTNTGLLSKRMLASVLRHARRLVA